MMDLNRNHPKRKAARNKGLSASLRRLAARRAVTALAAGSLLTAGLHSAQAGTFNYTGGGTAAAPVSGLFSNGFDNTVTTAGYGDTLSFAGATYTATDDLMSQISANSLSFTNTGAVTVARTSGASNTVSLGGTNPYINFNNTGATSFGLDLSFATSGFLIKTSGSTLPQSGAFNPIISGGINLGGVGNNVTVALNDTGNDSAAEMALTGVISGAGSLTLNNQAVVPTTNAALGTAANQDYPTLLVSGTNTYTGGTNINYGRLVVNNSSALGTGAISIAQGATSGGTLQLGNSNYTGHDNTANGTITTGITLANAINLGGAISGDYGNGIQNNQGNNTLSGIVTLTSAQANIAVGGGSLTIANGIGQASGVTASLVKNFGATLILTNNNTYTGTTTINGGYILAGNGGTLAGGVVTAGALFGSTSAIINNAGQDGGLTLNFSNAISLDVSTITGTPSTTTPGTFNNANGRITQAGTGTLTLTGTGTQGGYFTNNATLVVGSGATLTGSNYSSIGVNTGDHGTLNIQGTGSLNVGTDFNVGDNTGATGVLNMSGTSLAANALYFGKSANSTGQVTQTAGTVTARTGETWIGNGTGATGTYSISGGSLTTSNWLAVGRSAGSTGVLNISGTAAVTKQTGTGNITVAGNGGVETGTINQSGGTLTNTASGTWIGESGNGTYNMSGGTANLAVLDIDHAGSGAAVAGVVNLSGGTLSVTQVVKSGTQGTGTINFNGGTLQANTGAVATGSGTFLGGLDAANVQSGGVTIDTNGSSVTVTQALLHSGTGKDGGLTKVGAGTLTLSGTDTYNGTTKVTAGQLAVTTIASLGTGNLLLPSSTANWVNLGFTGTETIGALSFNLGSSFAPVGTYGAVGSGATFTSAAFTGSGILNVAAAPEPSQYAAFGLGLLGLGGLALRARRRSAA